MMRSRLVLAALLVLTAALVAQESTPTLRPRWGTIGASSSGSSPVVAITSPTVAPTYAAGATALTVSGSAADDGTITAVTWACPQCTPTSGTATGTTSWTLSLSVACSGGGTSNVITVTASDGTNTGNDVLTVTCATPDAVSPEITILGPTSAATYLTSTAAITLSGSALDNVGVTTVSLGCPTCTPTSRSCTVSGSNVVTWTCASVTLASGANTITLTASDAVGNMGTDVLTATLTAVDTTAPVVTITTNAGADITTSSSPVALAGTATDAVGVVTLSWSGTTCGSASISGTGTSVTWSTTISPSSGLACTVTVSATDEAGNIGTDTIGITYTADLQITTTTMPSAVPSSAYGPITLAATGGQTPYTWSNNGAGTTLNDADADCAGLTISAAGVVSGTTSTMSGGSGTCNWVASISDSQGVADTDTQALAIAASSESRFTYFDYQINKGDTGAIAGVSSGRTACDATANGTDCLIRITNCPDSAYGDNWQCRLAAALTGSPTAAQALAQLNALGSSAVGNPTTDLHMWSYVYDTDPYADKQRAARVQFPGDIASDGYCDNADGNPLKNGCADIATAEHLKLQFADISLRTPGHSVTIINDEYWTPEWLADGPYPTPAGDAIVANCTPGSADGLGSRPRFKQFALHARNQSGEHWLRWKTNNAHAGHDTWFQTATGDAGFWTCADNVIGTTYLSGEGTSIKNASTDSKVRLDAIGHSDPDSGFGGAPGGGTGQGAFWLVDAEDFPIMHSRWIRRVIHIETGVSADDALLDAWRADCNQWDRGTPIGTYAPNAAVVTTTAGSVDKECADMLTTIPDPDNTALFTVVSAWVMDEIRGATRMVYRLPWSTQNMKTSVELLLHEMELEFDSSANGCFGCANANVYVGPWIFIKDINRNDIDDGGANYGTASGCPTNCPGDAATITNNVLRKPRR